MVLCYATREGDMWQLAYPEPPPPNCNAVMYEDGWVYDRTLERRGMNPWYRPFDWFREPV